MGFASLLEDVIDHHDELTHLKETRPKVQSIHTPRANKQAAKRKRRSQSAQSRQHPDTLSHNPDFDTDDEAERYYRLKLRLVQKFIDYYKQDSQQLEQAKKLLPSHFTTIEQIRRTLQTVRRLCWVCRVP